MGASAEGARSAPGSVSCQHPWGILAAEDLRVKAFPISCTPAINPPCGLIDVVRDRQKKPSGTPPPQKLEDCSFHRLLSRGLASSWSPKLYTVGLGVYDPLVLTSNRLSFSNPAAAPLLVDGQDRRPGRIIAIDEAQVVVSQGAWSGSAHGPQVGTVAAIEGGARVEVG